MSTIEVRGICGFIRSVVRASNRRSTSDATRFVAKPTADFCSPLWCSCLNDHEIVNVLKYTERLFGVPASQAIATSSVEKRPGQILFKAIQSHNITCGAQIACTKALQMPHKGGVSKLRDRLLIR